MKGVLAAPASVTTPRHADSSRLCLEAPASVQDTLHTWNTISSVLPPNSIKIKNKSHTDVPQLSIMIHPLEFAITNVHNMASK
jgi:hypothetical protein